MLGQHCRPCELGDAFVNPEAGTAGHGTISVRDETLEARRREGVAEDLLDDVAAERLVARRAVERVRVEKAGRHRVHPRVRVFGRCAFHRDRPVSVFELRHVQR